MKFGVFVPQGWRFDLVGIDPSDQWQAMNGVAQVADAGAWDSLWVYDHFHTTPVPSAEATHEAWTLMAAFAASTSRIKLGQMCTCMAYRNPAYLAKVAATVDVISGGRAQMGIGAGWYEHEWRAYGYGFPRAGERLSMLDEGVQIMRQAWSEGVATFTGRHYQVDGAIVQPTPLQPEGIPLWIAGGGEKVTLKIAAQYATHTNFDGSPEGFARKSAILKEHCEQVGTDYSRIVRSSNYNSIIAPTSAEVDEKIAAFEDRMSALIGSDKAATLAAEYRSSLTTGTPEQIVERLQGMQEAGMTYAICYFPDAAYDTSSMELFATAVIPELS